MRHQLNSQSHEFLDIIEGLPSPISVFKLFIGLVVLEGKELFFVPDKRKAFNIIIDLFQHILSKYSEFEDSSIFQTNQ